MRIDAIIQSTNYADMLALTLPLNKGYFDSITVYTKVGDEPTKEVCAREGVTCIETNGFTANGSRFNRGKVYNEAFLHLLQTSTEMPNWVCILDSDIVLPPTFRAQFEGMEPDQECFYGARRYNVETMEEWQAVRADPDRLRKCLLYRGIGHGYLQCFSMRSSTFTRLWNETRGNPYLEWQDGSTADWVFRNHFGDQPWDPPTQPPDHILNHSVPEPCDPTRGLLRKLPFHVIHLGVTGVGANGRGTPLWTTPSA